jgi:hypothetical protein
MSVAEIVEPQRVMRPEIVRHQRWKTSWMAELQTSGGHTPCIVEDISAAGAKLRLGSAPAEGEVVSLGVVDFAPIVARVVWRKADRVGLHFAAKQPWVVDLVWKASASGR